MPFRQTGHFLSHHNPLFHMGDECTDVRTGSVHYRTKHALLSVAFATCAYNK